VKKVFINYTQSEEYVHLGTDINSHKVIIWKKNEKKSIVF